MLNPSKLLFLSTLFCGTLISISANSWFGAWMGLEINLLSFIPLISSPKNSLSTEASLKYFLIQALASSILLFSVILMHLNDMSLLLNQNLYPTLISSALMLKMGAAPFHFWFPGTMEGLNWINCIILMTWQKIAPLMLLSYTLPINLFSMMVIIGSIAIGSWGGLNQTSLRKLMAYSSINHLGWMIAAMYTGENTWMFYFLIYTFLSATIVLMFHTFQIYYMKQNFSSFNMTPSMKFCLFFLLLSLGGLPPFLGFLPKWLVIQALAELGQIFIVTVMVITTLITLFYYLRMTFSAFLLTFVELKWNKSCRYNNTINMSLVILACLSSMGLTMCSLIFNIL